MDKSAHIYRSFIKSLLKSYGTSYPGNTKITLYEKRFPNHNTIINKTQSPCINKSDNL